MRALFDSPAAIILLLLVIVLFGARRLPDAAKSVGKSIKAFKSEMDTEKPASGESGSESTDSTKP